MLLLGQQRRIKTCHSSGIRVYINARNLAFSLSSTRFLCIYSVIIQLLWIWFLCWSDLWTEHAPSTLYHFSQLWYFASYLQKGKLFFELLVMEIVIFFRHEEFHCQIRSSGWFYENELTCYFLHLFLPVINLNLRHICKICLKRLSANILGNTLKYLL